METIIRKIRKSLGMSQQEFADMLGTSFSSVNRWENGHSNPGKLAQRQLYELCMEQEISVHDMIHEKIRSVTDHLDIQSERRILYHGSKSGIQGKIKPQSRDKCDFGSGFYMGTEPEQPLTLISDFDHSRFYIVSIDLTDLKKLIVKPDLEWAMLVAFNRGKLERINGVNLANDICRNYRREGLFFDEILAGDIS